MSIKIDDTLDISLNGGAGRMEVISDNGLYVTVGAGETVIIEGGSNESGEGGRIHLVPGNGDGSSNRGKVRTYYFADGGSDLYIAMEVNKDGVRIDSKVGFNTTTPIAKPTVSGSKGGNAALASLITALANYGLITDSTS